MLNSYLLSTVNNLQLHFVEVIQKVITDSLPYRPEIPPVHPADKGSKVVTLMTECWLQDPASRPTFNEIKRRLKVINNGR